MMVGLKICVKKLGSVEAVLLWSLTPGALVRGMKQT